MDSKFELERLRKEIDSIDEQLLMLFEDRLRLVKDIGSVKQKSDMPILDVKRQKQLLDRIKKLSNSQLHSYDEKLFKQIMLISKEYQASIVSCHKRVLVINGPNMNMLGEREVEVYSSDSYEDMIDEVIAEADRLNVRVDFVQHNSKADIIESVQMAKGVYYGIIINPAAYTHTDLAIADAIRAVGIKTVEVHISDISKREDYRVVSYISEACCDVIYGQGIYGYVQALRIICMD